jgi:nitroreductase
MIDRLPPGSGSSLLLDEAVRARGSVRAFRPDPAPYEVVAELLTTATTS